MAHLKPYLPNLFKMPTIPGGPAFVPMTGSVGTTEIAVSGQSKQNEASRRAIFHSVSSKHIEN